jgi:hypothetical protein
MSYIGLFSYYQFDNWAYQYALGEDALNTPGRVRYHTDDSIQIKYFDNPERFLDKPPSRLPEIWDASMVAASAAPAILRRVPSRAFWVT